MYGSLSFLGSAQVCVQCMAYSYLVLVYCIFLYLVWSYTNYASELIVDQKISWYDYCDGIDGLICTFLLF